MKIKIEVASVAYDTEYGGEQTIPAERGEYLLDEVFKLPFFRIIIDEIIDGAVCFRLMEGGVPHYYVLDGESGQAAFSRETSIGYDDFTFTLIDC